MRFKYIFLLSILIISPFSISAESYDKALALFNEGTERYNIGEYAEAVILYDNAENIFTKLSAEYDLSVYTSLWRGIAYNSLFEYNSAITDLKNR